MMATRAKRAAAKVAFLKTTGASLASLIEAYTTATIVNR